MGKEKKTGFGGFNLLGIPLDPTLGVGEKILDHIDESIEIERKKEVASKYWACCPSCGKKVIRQELIERGCFVCGWQGTESELEITEAKRKGGPIGFEVGKVVLSQKKPVKPYYSICPKCGHKVINEELEERGCYVCEYKPNA